jgi:hypothetical protein
MRQNNGIWGFFIITILFVEQGCEYNQNPEYDYQVMWKCHYKNIRSHQTTKNQIVGLWEWKYIKCCGETKTPYQNSTESKGLKIQFNADGTGTVTDKDAIGEFHWDIQIKDNDLYGFETRPSISQLAGRLLFCNNTMMCNDSYVDGFDNYLEKIAASIN